MIYNNTNRKLQILVIHEYKLGSIYYQYTGKSFLCSDVLWLHPSYTSGIFYPSQLQSSEDTMAKSNGLYINLRGEGGW